MTINAPNPLTTRKRIVVLISGTGTTLVRMIEAIRADEIHGEIVAVISNRPGVAGLTRAAEAAIDAFTLDHTRFSQREHFDTILRQMIDEHTPDLVVLAGFMRVLTPEFVTWYDGRMINIHPSLLPNYPGMHTHARALEAGETEHGCSVHFVNKVTDGGPIVIQARVPVLANDTPESLRARVLEQEHVVYPLVVRWFCADRLRWQQQELFFDDERLTRPFQLGGANPYLPEVI